MLVPDSDLLMQFENAVQPLTRLKLNLYDQYNNLRGGRDRLLPRLISGKLSVENLDIQFPPGMADQTDL